MLLEWHLRSIKMNNKTYAEDLDFKFSFTEKDIK